MNMMNFTSPKRVRRQFKQNVGRMRGGKLVPVMFHAIRESEGGVLSQTFNLELDPIPGRLTSEMILEFYDIFVPLQAIDAILDPAAAYAGMTEVVREKLLSATPIFDVEAEGPISKKAKVNPRSVAGTKVVNKAVRLAYNAAVNMLRQRAYFRATLVAHTNTAILPAIYAQTVLDKINGVLDPDDRINGAVNLELPAMNLPVKGIGSDDATTTTVTSIRETGGTTVASGPGYVSSDLRAKATGVNGWPDITALFSGAGATMSLDEFYNAQRIDEFTRRMDDMMRNNPQYGGEMVLRWAHGLSIDAGRVPFIVAERRIPINRTIQGAMDSAGVNNDVMRTDGTVAFNVSIPIPRTELGGMIVTLVALKPDEKLASQPEPFLSEPWTHQNYVADTLALDPVPVTVRDLYSDCTVGTETNVVAYTGLNALKEMYVDYGFARDIDLADVDAKTAIWQIEVPLSVNPDNVNYPDYIDHGVFAFGGTEGAPEDVATFRIDSVQNTPTPMIVGPTPVEDIGLDNAALFEE
jgi:hypothetical protein